MNILHPSMRQSPSIFLLLLTLGAGTACKSSAPAAFASPEAAMRELAETIGTHDEARTDRLLGANGLELLSSGDEIADTEDALRVQKFIREKIAFEEQGPDTRIALVGNESWPFPLPLVREADGWRFDVEAGVEELANRRIGRNEISTLAALHAYVDAQREYASQSRDGTPRAFASKFLSSDGKHDGLYWPTAEGEPESPIGSLIAQAASEGYELSKGERLPFHGYYFRMLSEQGAHAPGGAKSFVDKSGRMTGGFALLAWPAKYGSSGLMSFQVHQQGIVYQRDLGPETETQIARILAFDPDAGWDPTGD